MKKTTHIWLQPGDSRLAEIRRKQKAYALHQRRRAVESVRREPVRPYYGKYKRGHVHNLSREMARRCRQAA